MRKLLLLSALFSACYLGTTTQPNNGYNNGYNNNNYNGENPPASQPSAYPSNNNNGGYGISTTPQPSEGGYGISTPNLGPDATYSCEAKCNDSKTAVTCQGAAKCNAWCDDYNVPHAECQ